MENFLLVDGCVSNASIYGKCSACRWMDGWMDVCVRVYVYVYVLNVCVYLKTLCVYTSTACTIRVKRLCLFKNIMFIHLHIHIDS